MAAEKEDIDLADLLPGLEDALKQTAGLGLPDPADYHVSASVVAGGSRWARVYAVKCPL